MFTPGKSGQLSASMTPVVAQFFHHAAAPRRGKDFSKDFNGSARTCAVRSDVIEQLVCYTHFECHRVQFGVLDPMQRHGNVLCFPTCVQHIIIRYFQLHDFDARRSRPQPLLTSSAEEPAPLVLVCLTEAACLTRRLLLRADR